jgi:hypothetical protein
MRTAQKQGWRNGHQLELCIASLLRAGAGTPAGDQAASLLLCQLVVGCCLDGEQEAEHGTVGLGKPA